MKAYYERMEQSARIMECSDLSFPEHLHKEVELIYIEEGEALVTIGKKQKLLTEGEMGIMFPNTVHSYEAKSHYRGFILIFPPEMAGDYQTEIIRNKCGSPFPDHLYLHKDVYFCLESLKRQEVRQRPSLIKGYLIVLMGNLLKNICLEPAAEKKTDDMSELILQFMMEHYRERILLTDLSAKLGIGKYTISRFFHQELGCGFNDYVNTLRISYARHLLGNPKMPITEIALEAGFSSLRSFNRAFRELHGFSPSEYRKKIFYY